MADFIIKSAAGTGNKTLIQGQDQSGSNYAIQVGDGGDVTFGGTVTGAGVQCAQQFMLTSSKTGVTSGSDITANISEISSIGAISSNTSSQGSLVSQSSGIFSFSKTGIYHIIFDGKTTQTSDSEYVLQNIKTTVNNSTYVVVAEDVSSRVLETGSDGLEQVISQCFFDVTSTTNCKCKFAVSAGTSSDWRGHATIPMTKFMFIRISDT